MKNNIKISVLTSLYNCSQYLEGYFQCLLEVENLDEIEVILLHNAPEPSEINIIRKYQKKLGLVLHHVIIEKRESLYKTWNRGIKLAKGKYITIWNVDDIRLPNSLKLEADTLDKNTEAGITYGDLICVEHYGQMRGTLFKHPEFKGNQFPFLRGYYGTCFPMWRKSVHEKVGYFDEQFFSAGDFDFWVRVVHEFPPVKTNAILGYFLQSPNEGISKRGNINNVERTVIELRYGIFDKINFFFIINAILNYSIFSMSKDNAKFPVKNYFSNYFIFWFVRIPLIILGLIKFPFKFVLPTFLRFFKEIKSNGFKDTSIYYFKKLFRVSN